MEEREVKINPIEHFFAALAKRSEIKEQMTDWFEERSERLLAAMQDGSRLDKEDLKVVESVVVEVLLSEGGVVGSMPAGMPGYEFSIDIHHFGPVFWASAVEFDDLGYFDSLEDAKGYASIEWGSFIDAYEECKADSDDE
ncbi:MAG: hypothetical protein P1U58_14260 [Verrucomicrobiales bacterium]|nr:hypothetical protein [Verrucomicrobiales bacterium]